MSVEVKNITKLYGTQRALDDVSFTVEPGQVVGFLGPNGAGKSTMMKIITCFLPQNSGTVSVDGFDVTADPIKVRERVGYLPEHNPLYHDMYVKEFLSFIAGIQLPSATVASRVKDMIEVTGLGAEQHKKIGALSKGYRQRVGLAQAMIHNPSVLILDEPTTGLDPNQLVDIRKLIKNIGKEKTVILSTHIMQEVEAICDRVVIINKGKIVADDKTSFLQQKSDSETIILVEFDKAVSSEKLSTITGIKKVLSVNDKTYKVIGPKGQDLRPLIFNFAVQNNLAVITMQKEENSLESVFRQLTSKK
ncbi:MAG: gliding motility-associated ABC transporter ATP-binding subunit GldA [Bacteroidota bacterium]|jgi:ABC-2 type transport system ATP-binding protein